MRRALGALVRRQPVLLSPEAAQRRLNVCEAPCIFFDSAARRCRKCECYVDAKAILATEDCPQKLWK